MALGTWWTDLKGKAENKSSKGVTAPETDFEKKAKAYDQLRGDLSGVTLITLPKIKKALDDVEPTRKPSAKTLEKDFFKLATQCGPTGRVLTAKIAEEKALLDAKEKELKAKQAIGNSQMTAVGPGSNMRQKSYKTLQDNFKKLLDELKKGTQLKPEVLANYEPWLKTFAKDVALYCKDRPGAAQYLQDYQAVVAQFAIVTGSWGTPKGNEALLAAVKHLDRMEKTAYIA